MRKAEKYRKEKNSKTSFEANSIVVFSLTMLANVLGILFQSLAGHLLGDTQLFADLSAVMALFNVLVLPTTVCSCLITKYTAELYVGQHLGQVKYFLLNSAKVLMMLILLFAIVGMTAYPLIGRWLHIRDKNVVLLVIGLAAITLLSAVFNGGLQGMQAFVFYGIFGLIGPVAKIIAVLCSTLVTEKLTVILAVWFLGTIISYLCGAWLLRKRLGRYPKEKVDLKWNQIISYVVHLIVANASVILLSNLDLLLVKHSFNAEAGLYSGARMLGYSVMYLTSTFVVIIFPMIAGQAKAEKENKKLLKKTLWYNIMLSAIAAVCLMLSADFFISLLLGTDYLSCRQYLFPIMTYVIPLGILNLLANFGMARDNTRFINVSLLMTGSIAIVIGVVVKTSVFMLMGCLSTVMWLAVGGNLVYVFGRKKKGSQKKFWTAELGKH